MSDKITIKGGIGRDDEMSNLGDFMATVLRMYREMLYHNQTKNFILQSNLVVKTEARMYNHFYPYMNKSEYDLILEQPFIQDWIEIDEKRDIIQMVCINYEITIETGDLIWSW